MQRFAITFRIKPGTEDAVRELLAGYEPPARVAPDGTRLLSTSVFMKDCVVVRMIEIEGDLRGLIAHISREPGIQAVERELDKYLVEEDKRDASTPDGARLFFKNALMEHVTTRVAPPTEFAEARA
jgi:quinol monooxygenase YgiN